MKYILSFSLLIVFLSTAAQNFEPEELVNPLMGTDSKHSLSNGNTYPAIALPWGMNFWMPQTGKMGDGWAYQYAENKIRGFKQTHQPSPWINDYGQFSIMPMTNTLAFDENARASWFSHKSEIVKPYYYSVYLADHNVTTEIAPTERAASFRFTFPKTDSAFVVIDAFDKGSYIKILPKENAIIGYTTKNSGGVPQNFRNYFIIRFSKAFTMQFAVHDKLLSTDILEYTANHAGAIIGFATSAGEKITANVASSFISHEQAALNLDREIGNQSFHQIATKAKQAWHKELSKIKVEGGTVAQQQTFYSCLYRVLLFPRKFYEYDAANTLVHYSPYNGKVLPGYMFTDNGFWDTFRAVFPFFTLMYPTLDGQIMEGLANAYKESGWLPEWASPGHRDCMIGSNSASLIADAYSKGIRGFDINTLYEAAVKNSQQEGPLSSVGRKGVKWYNELGYVPYNVGVNENAARTLEYAYADFCLYQLAKQLNRPSEEIETFRRRSMNYKNLFDPKHKLMRGKDVDGNFQTPFNPFKWGDAFTEGNSWHYTWSVFQDVEGLKQLMGGNDAFVAMLDSVFKMPPVYDQSYYGAVIHEIREMQIMNMGQYAHGNQPIQHMIYLYNYTNQGWKAQYWLREVMNRLYSATPDGYCGDEDNGQTSAWYVFSALGFYPVTPGSNEYVLGSPLFKKATLQLENGKQLVIDAPNNNSVNRYVSKVSRNGKVYTKQYFNHGELMMGGTIQFNMSAQPAIKKKWNLKDFPFSLSLQR
jgi:predicted alpha-1,2-mannosidase